MNRRQIRAHYRKFLATYTLDALPVAGRTLDQLVTCQLEYDGTSFTPVIGESMSPRNQVTGLLKFRPVSMREHGLGEFVALLHLAKSTETPWSTADHCLGL